MVKSIDLLYKRAKKYTETNTELLALKTVDKIADVLSSLTVIVLIVIVFAMFTLFINVGLSLFIGNLLNEYFYHLNLLKFFPSLRLA